MLFLGGLSLAFSIALCVHVVRTHQQMYWLWIILAFQPIGGLAYLVAVILPDVSGGSTARRLKKAARDTLDPGRAHREAKAAYDEVPTVANIIRYAQACSAMEDHAQAERLYAQAAQGIHADDPSLHIGRAEALVELGRNDEALAVLTALGQQGEIGRTPRAALAMARAHHALGRAVEAEGAYQWAAERMPGLEASARYAIFLNDYGRHDEAREALADLDKRVKKTTPHFRREARAWRDLAAQAIIPIPTLET